MGISQLNISEAGLIALSGVVIVFLMLACLCGIIVLISRMITVLIGIRYVGMVSPTAQPTPKPTPTAPAAPAAPAPVQLIGVDDLTAACIMAIVCDKTGFPPEELQFKVIQAL